MIDLSEQRILVTQSQDFMGPALCQELRACGAEVIADQRVLTAPQDVQAMIDAAGPLDALAQGDWARIEALAREASQLPR